MRARPADSARGFTLVEVLVALAILGLVAGGVLALTAQNARFASAAETRLLAGILLDNEMVETLGRTSALERGETKDSVEFARRPWTVDKTISGLDDKGLVQIEIKILDGTGKAEASAITVKAESQ